MKIENSKKVESDLSTEKDLIHEIREEIFWLIKHKAESLEIVHWLIWVDDCFENDELYNSDLENLRWRLWVLGCKHFDIPMLLGLITRLMRMRDFVDENGEWIGPKNTDEEGK